jgi:aspartate aminotransferase
VAVLPGTDFGRQKDELTMRIAYVDFDGAAALDASIDHSPGRSLPDGFSEKHCGKVVEAVNRLCEWITRSR